MRKTNKAALARDKPVLPSETIPGRCATIIDDTSLVQKTKSNDQAFSQLADAALIHILHEGVMSHIIGVVFYVYQEDSIKNAQISNRIVVP